MNSFSLPTDYQSFIYYVYQHRDPRTGQLLYVGHGCRGRAWIHGSKRTCLRSQEHLNHLESMIQDGFIPTDWTEILTSGIEKKSACRIEQEVIRDFEPKYNKPQGRQLLKVTPEQYKICKDLRKKGSYYHEIASKIGVSVMTVYRALNGKTKNIGSNYAE